MLCLTAYALHWCQSHRQGTRQSAQLLRMATFSTQLTALFFALTDRTLLNLMHCIATQVY